jgi:hypothetical protein
VSPTKRKLARYTFDDLLNLSYAVQQAGLGLRAQPPWVYLCAWGAAVERLALAMHQVFPRRWTRFPFRRRRYAPINFNPRLTPGIASYDARQYGIVAVFEAATVRYYLRDCLGLPNPVSLYRYPGRVRTWARCVDGVVPTLVN